MKLSDFRDAFNPRFEQIIRVYLNEQEDILQDTFLYRLLAHSEELFKGGKRIRPYMASVGYAIGGGKNQEDIHLMGAALEIFHCFCLIHDDVIDKATVRRGVPTLEAFTQKALQDAERHGDHAHVARSQAILMGDLLFSWANECALRAGKQQTDALDQYYRMVKEVVGGQMIDVDTTTREEHDLALLERKMYLKTAGYSFVHPLSIGVRLAAPAQAPAYLASCQQIGTTLGIAFQIQDDLFDVIQTEEILGKPTLADIRDGQQTYLTAFLSQNGSQEMKNLLHRVIRGHAEESDVQRLKLAMETSGACEAARTRIATLIEQTKEEISRSAFSSTTQEELRSFVDLIEHRTS